MNTSKNPTAHAADERLDGVRRTAPPSGGGLTNLQINERIAIALGTNRTDNIYAVKTFNLPNYAGSIDACQEFEIPLQFSSGSDGFDYVETLAKVSGGDVAGGILTVTASARQRCEAFLRMKGQWE